MVHDEIQKIRLTASFHDYHMRGWVWFLAIVFLISGFAVRMVDLKDEPLDFHPTRQLRGAIIARGIYYTSAPDADSELRTLAINLAGKTGQYEPPLLENLVALAYKFLGGENIWIVRVINSAFWILAGYTLFLLAAHMTNPTAALVALGYYLFLPFGIEASRSFQPDPGMVMWMVFCVYAIYRWSYDPKWKWAFWAGLCGGMAILTKALAIYIVAVVMIIMVLHTLGIKRSLFKFQVWFMAVLVIAPSFGFYFWQHQSRAAEYFNSWTIALSHLLQEPATYVRWFNMTQNLMGISILVLAMIGMVISKSRERTLIFSLWVGYAIYGLTVPYQMYTHNYYHLLLIPLLGISISPIAQQLIDKVSAQKFFWQFIATISFILTLVFLGWSTASGFIANDFRHEPAHWQKIGTLLPADGKILALTQDYGYRLLYYGWRKVILWQPTSELELAELRGMGKEFENQFTNKTDGMDYFLVTAFNQFEKQTQLKEFLYATYPILAEGNGYLIFDLKNPIQP